MKRVSCSYVMALPDPDGGKLIMLIMAIGEDGGRIQDGGRLLECTV